MSWPRLPCSGEGCHKCHARKDLVEAEDWEGPKYQTCFNASNVCKRFEINRRRLTLSFAHHAEVAALPPAEADALLDWCERSSQPPHLRDRWMACYSQEEIADRENLKQQTLSDLLSEFTRFWQICRIR
jgi:hypothetical protein